GSRDVQNGVEIFDDLQTEGQGDLHFSLATDPANPGVVYLGGDTMPATRENSAVGNTGFTGRLFRVDTSVPYVPTMTGDRSTEPARGEQITAQNALLKRADATMAATPGLPGAGVVTDGTYQYAVSFVDANGVESNPSVPTPLVVAGSDTGTTVALS